MVGMTAICRRTLKEMREEHEEFNSSDFVDAVLKKRLDLSTHANIDKPIIQQLYRATKKGIIVKTSDDQYQFK